MVKSYEKANHPLVATIEGGYDIVPGGFGKKVSPGTRIDLKGSATDPDDDSLSYKWWQYFEQDSVSTEISIKNSVSQFTNFIVPNESGKQIHIILEVKDNGTPNLKGYQRLLFNIK